MTELSKRIAALSPEQQILLRQRLQQKQNPSSRSSWTITPLTAEEKNRPLTVSFGQQRMWFQDQLGRQSAVSNNVSISLRITGNLDVNVIEISLREIICRHEVLRTTFQTIDGELKQIINPVGNWYLPVIDLRAQSTPEQEIDRLAQAQACQPFNLAQEMLLRASLLVCSRTNHILLLTLHHISMDAWSIGVFFHELQAIYGALIDGHSSPLPPLPIQYADFALWQRQHLQGQRLEADLAYWRQKLHQAPDLLLLPTDRPRPPVQSFTGKTLSFTIPKAIADDLRELSQATGTTPFTIVLTALKILLFRYSGQEDILIGTPIANRQQPELENLMGCFINTLVLRSDLSGNPSFRTLLQQVRETVLEALAHQTLPFEKLVDELQIARNFTYAPLFQVMLVFQNAFSIEQIQLPHLQIEHDRIDNHTSQFDVTMHLVEAEVGLIGKLEYNTDLFDESTIERWLAHFQTLLSSIITDPDRAIATLNILPAAELQQLQIWNDRAVAAAPTIGIEALFAAGVRQHPDAIAVIAGEEQLTYQELDRRANQLARYLRRWGVQPDSLAGICIDRSIDTMVGLWGIIKAGGAYVPLDPAYPAERLAFILDDARVSVLLTTSSLVAKLPSSNTTHIFLDRDWEQIAQEDPADLDLSLPIERLAYIIYTSGSTGTPKGVMVQHDSLINYTVAAIQEYEISPRDRVLQFASLSFDAAAEEIFPCWLRGGTLVLRNEVMLGSISLFLDTCAAWQITVLDLPTAFWHQMVTTMAAERLTLPDTVRLVILGGEKAARDRFLTWQQLVKPQVRLVNSYGPTEATIVTTTIDLSPFTAAVLGGRELPIGKPVLNARTYILDSHLQPTPIGIPGELYIGGIGVARGYLHRPDLTAQSFIPHPQEGNRGERLYKTGDRARYLANGTIEFGGRIDRQVKLRGFRIELGEIESALDEHPHVRESLVIDRMAANDDKQLIAYVVPLKGSEPTPRSLRRHLEQRLPKYAIPAAFVLLSAFPLNPNGKIDRQMLPPAELDRSTDSTFIAPRNPIEAAIARIFAEVLNCQQVSVEDDFFDLGGHSLLATKLMGQLLATFEVSLSIVDLFQSPTVAGLAERIAHLQADITPSLPPLKRTYVTTAPLSFSQESIWAWHHAGSSSSALNSSIVVRIRGDLSPVTVEQSIDRLVRRHEILRTVFVEIDARPMQQILPTLHIPLGYRDLRRLRPEEREAAAQQLAIELATPEFDLATAPLFRAHLLQLHSDEHWLLLTMHHIITDGNSFNLLLQELYQLIDSNTRGIPSPLPDVPFQYTDWVIWQQQPENETEIERQLAYWKEKLTHRDTLPTAPPAWSNASKYYFCEFPSALVQEIEALSRQRGVTTFTVLATGLQLALAYLSGRSSIAIVTTVGNRTLPQTAQMLGCFINEVILQSDLTGDLTIDLALQNLHSDIHGAIAHKDVPFERVLDQIDGHSGIDLMASLTVTNSTQGLASLPGWELVSMQTQPQAWEDITAELYEPETPLEFYVEMSSPMRVMVNYGIEQYSATAIAQLLTTYQSILATLTQTPHLTVAQVLQSLAVN